MHGCFKQVAATVRNSVEGARILIINVAEAVALYLYEIALFGDFGRKSGQICLYLYPLDRQLKLGKGHFGTFLNQRKHIERGKINFNKAASVGGEGIVDVNILALMCADGKNTE